MADDGRRMNFKSEGEGHPHRSATHGRRAIMTILCPARSRSRARPPADETREHGLSYEHDIDSSVACGCTTPGGVVWCGVVWCGVVTVCQSGNETPRATTYPKPLYMIRKHCWL
jgi:hypothetical protein